ncbi:hypothetical protein BUE80_DR006725 [Diplocarpon rosae]|nr:hypothetical protein BUE80_DR006725 [Diplocarpon rosae]
MCRESLVHTFHLGSSQKRRRIGLNPSDSKQPSLLPPFNATPTRSPWTMPPEAVASRMTGLKKYAVEDDSEEDINRPPESSDEDEGANIKGTEFKTAAAEDSQDAEAKRVQPSTKTRAKTAGNRSPSKDGSRVTQGSKRYAKPTPISGDSPTITLSSANMDGQDETAGLAAGKNEDWIENRGAKRHKMAPRYGNSSSKSKILVTKKKALKTYGVPATPQKSDAYNGRHSRSPSLETDDEMKSNTVLREASGASPPSIPPKKDKPGKLRIWQVDESEAEDEVSGLPANSESVASTGIQKPATYQSPARPKFKTYRVDQETDEVSKIQDLLDVDLEQVAPLPIDDSDDDDFLTLTQQARCPMCGAQVSPDAIRECSRSGHMSIRIQERFCRSHRVKSAEEDWEIGGYPKINWDALDARITKHHSFIKKLINGQDSHYRDLLTEKVSAGKDRNLMQMTSSLTPGYYGARGLRAISENIFHKFTPLLKRRMVLDPLMSARGYTAYVQTVLVPEVTVKLITEDMHVDAATGRRILSDSVAMGELLSEEVEDILQKEVVDSDNNRAGDESGSG